MKIKYPTIGPIIGETTNNRVRLFIRGDLEWSDDHPRRCHGVYRIKKSDSAQFEKPQYFKLNPNFDMTGIAVIENLSDNTYYDYEIGWLFSDVDSKEIDVDKVLNWSDTANGSFCTSTSDKTQARSVIAGSCRYMLKLLGGIWFDDRGDKTFRSIQQIVDKEKPKINQLIMIGDQIYADDLNIIGPDKTSDDYFKRYREVFSQPCIRNLMTQIPTYMTLDDHEIEDNWPKNASSQDLVTKFPAAIHAYQTYQLSHSPCIPTSDSKLEGTLSHLWYTYSDGCLDVFAMDTRTERNLTGNPKKIINEEQFTALKNWLNDGSQAIKLILSSVPIVGCENSDKWSGFPEQRLELLNHIAFNSIQKVVFLSGDVHASWSCEISLDYIDCPKIISIISSAFFWPYPVSAVDTFQKTGNIPLTNGKNIRLTNSSEICRDDNFTRIDFSTNKVIVSIYKRKGERFSRKVHNF